MSNANISYFAAYEAGFLDEAASSGMPFMNAAADNPICMLKLCGPANKIQNAKISHINIRPSDPLKFKCDIHSNGVQLVSHYHFEQYANEYVFPADVVHGVVKVESDLFISYSVKLSDNYSTPPLDISPELALILSPFSLEPYVGDVHLKINTLTNSVALDMDLEFAANRIPFFKEGNNYDLSSEELVGSQLPVFNFTPIAGSGIGQEPCQTSTTTTDYIASINGVIPNDRGEVNFTSEEASCLSIFPDQKINKIKLNSHCPPCCRCTDYKKVRAFIRSYAVIYARIAEEFGRLRDEYNSVTAQFSTQSDPDCCDTLDKVNPRVRTWPQQNFMLQVQAMMQNNKKVPVCLCEVDLRLEVYSSDNDISATETITNLDGTTYQVVHTLPENTALAITPIAEGSYVYFKNVNPGNKINITTNEGVGKIKTNVQVNGSNGLPIPEPCDETSVQSNCMEPCDGYFMITSALSIANPIFRKIVNLNGTPVPVKVNVNLKYKGTDTNPCGACQWIDLYSESKTVNMAPNKKSVNACAPAKLQNIVEFTPDDPALPVEYRATFSESVTSIAEAVVQVVVKAFSATTEEYTDIHNQNITIPQNQTLSYVVLPNPYTIDIPPTVVDPVGIVMTAFTDGTGLVTKCQPNPDSSHTVDIGVAPGSVGYSVQI